MVVWLCGFVFLLYCGLLSYMGGSSYSRWALPLPFVTTELGEGGYTLFWWLVFCYLGLGLGVVWVLVGEMGGIEVWEREGERGQGGGLERVRERARWRGRSFFFGDGR